ncbi:MAG: hypothetical protein HRJ53_26325, partial [Acidobacteria bacterium Pan2503]|nr:hypothetical protein [Candidatus Acidoferrum panamensis]
MRQCRYEKRQATRFAVLLFSLLRAAEAKQCLAASRGWREAALEIFLDGEFEMSGHFRVEIAIELRAAEQ